MRFLEDNQIMDDQLSSKAESWTTDFSEHWGRQYVPEKGLKVKFVGSIKGEFPS